MGLFDSIKNLFGVDKKSTIATRIPLPPAHIDPEPEFEVPEVAATALIDDLAQGADIVLLDCRESFERKMAYIPNDFHIPMNEVPNRLDELADVSNGKSKEIVVYCASGMRSFGVAYFLAEQGFSASNLSGGITAWQMAQGSVLRDIT